LSPAKVVRGILAPMLAGYDRQGRDAVSVIRG
jgi:hypothetical protein